MNTIDENLVCAWKNAFAQRHLFYWRDGFEYCVFADGKEAVDQFLNTVIRFLDIEAASLNLQEIMEHPNRAFLNLEDEKMSLIFQAIMYRAPIARRGDWERIACGLGYLENASMVGEFLDPVENEPLKTTSRLFGVNPGSEQIVRSSFLDHASKRQYSFGVDAAVHNS
jgi:hypothetical protein